ncbi:ATP-dependent Clp protease adapter ClpS [Desulforhopalus singaporensis]|uniref:ATP-dependent Clp protease adapter protein ClpS n=1 Tax=Desulforhopalus singaporensis TaxID=91360 RepID=A0A1H0Q9H1_9BACT|nr:ATP-dependent Clp protease adapter ClpS [Desulforhopalus singaporensis]SDP13318.1 ATP-dependent Clp protease adaptor protein ClpS [Desulforhopalus singaporensis]
MAKNKNQHESSVLTEDATDVKEPKLYKVLLHNDDYTTMEFVISILETVFHKSTNDATKIMLNVHNEGIGIAGVYTREICETKISVVHQLAKKNEFPLRCSMETV